MSACEHVAATSASPRDCSARRSDTREPWTGLAPKRASWFHGLDWAFVRCGADFHIGQHPPISPAPQRPPTATVKDQPRLSYGLFSSGLTSPRSRRTRRTRSRRRRRGAAGAGSGWGRCWDFPGRRSLPSIRRLCQSEWSRPPGLAPTGAPSDLARRRPSFAFG